MLLRLNLRCLQQVAQWRQNLCSVVRRNSHAVSAEDTVSLKAKPRADSITLTWPDGTEAVYHTPWLRDHCLCRICRHPTNLTRNLDTCSPSVSNVLLNASVDHGTQSLLITWADGHKSNISTHWLLANRYGGSAHDCSPPYDLRARTVAWDNATLKRCFPEITFDHFQRKEGLKSVLQWLHRYGIAFLQGVPCKTESSLGVLKRLGGVQRTMYGKVWQATPKPHDPTLDGDHALGYRRAALNLHTDCSFLHDSPAVVLLHSFEPASSASSDGSACGQSQFVDGFFVAKQLQKRSPAAFRYLCSTPLVYQNYFEDVVEQKMNHSVSSKKIFSVDGQGKIVGVCHADYHRAPLTYLKHHEVPHFYQPMEALQTELSKRENMLELLLSKGTVALVHNHRVLHARKAFTGHRLLTIGYVSKDQFEHSLRRELLDEKALSYC